MNVYDFDKTIYAGDSTLDFYLFCLKRQPALIRFFPKQFLGLLQFHLKMISKEQFKEDFFSFLNGINGKINILVDDFWTANSEKIFSFYFNQKEATDVIISASPDFLLRPILTELGIDCLIATKVNPTTGNFLGKNCFGNEKVIRFKEVYKNTRPEKFFSDSLSDLPMGKYANAAFLVRRGKIVQAM